MGGVSSPLTEEAVEAFCEAALDEIFEATVFFLSLPSSARFACRAAFEADTMANVGTISKVFWCLRTKKISAGHQGLSIGRIPGEGKKRRVERAHLYGQYSVADESSDLVK